MASVSLQTSGVMENKENAAELKQNTKALPKRAVVLSANARNATLKDKAVFKKPLARPAVKKQNKPAGAAGIKKPLKPAMKPPLSKTESMSLLLKENANARRVPAPKKQAPLRAAAVIRAAKQTAQKKAATSQVIPSKKETVVKQEPQTVLKEKEETEDAKDSDLQACAQVEPTAMDISLNNSKTSEAIEDLQVSFSQLSVDIEDIDEDDMEEPLLAAAYVKDIYKYLHALEDKYPIKNMFLREHKVSEKHRTILVDWLILIHSRLSLLQETLYLCIALLDRYLQADRDLKKNQLQLVGATCMFLAAKYEELLLPSISDFIYLSDNAFKERDMKLMEMKVFKAVYLHFGHPLPIHFLRRDSKAAGVDASQHSLAKFFLELSLIEYSMAHLKPSHIAAASLCLAILVLDDIDEPSRQKEVWHPVVQYYSRYKYEELLPVMRKLAVLCVEACGKKNTIAQKYASVKFKKVSLCPQLKNSVLVDFAKQADADN